MRLIGELKNLHHARTFSDYLTQAGIENQVMDEAEGDQTIYEIWIVSEDDVPRSEELLKKFQENPDDPEYRGVSRIARKIKKQAEKEAKQSPPYMDARTTVFYRGPTPNGPLTIILILACVAIGVISQLGKNINPIRIFFITEFIIPPFSLTDSLPEIWRGQIWRLFTPMFIHFGIWHLLFNMLWLRDLGSMVEDRKGTLFLAIFILVVSSISNLTQFLFDGPLFGGMSGVVYGLLGYIWMKGKFDPASRLSLHKTTVGMMIFWFFFCFTGLAGNIANGAHAAGLIIGIAWGYLSSGKIKQHLKKLKG